MAGVTSAADITGTPGVIAQVWLVAGLRWRILRNNLRKKNSRWDLIGMVFAGLWAALVVLSLGAGVVAGTVTFLSTGHPERIGWLYWGIFLWWQLLPLFVAGFGLTFQFKLLLRFPLSLKAFYLLSLGYGLLDFTALASLFWLVLMAVAAAAVKPAVVPAMLLASVLFVIVNVTIERLLGSWLERLMARRRSREIFFALFILMLLTLQFVAPLLQRYGTSARALAEWAIPHLAAFPASLAVAAVASPFVSVATAEALGLLALWAVAFGGLLWLRCAAQYHGEELSESMAPVPVKARSAATAARVSDRSILPPAVAAVFAKEFRYLVRNGMAFLVLFIPPLFVLLFSIQFTGKNPTALHRGLSADMFFPGMMAYVVLVLMTPAYNSFAYESRGIQAYYLSPLRFRTILLGKNAMLACLMAVETLLCVAVLMWRVGIPAPPVLAATLAAIVFAVASQFTVANWSSLSFPRKLVFGQMRGQRNSGVAVWIAFGAQSLVGGTCAAVFFGGRLLGGAWMPAVAFVLLSAFAIAGYAASLDALSGLAERNKELMIETLSR